MICFFLEEGEHAALSDRAMSDRDRLPNQRREYDAVNEKALREHTTHDKREYKNLRVRT